MNYKTKAGKNKVIPNLIWNLQRLPLSFLNNLRGRSRIKYGMTSLFNNGGFTLIELLVVVLIIGILAAVAVPQYQRGVLKSRASTMLGILSGLVQAEEIYFVANGQYTTDARLLDIEMPGECTLLDDEDYDEGSRWSCKNGFMISLAMYGNGAVASAIYCPNANTSRANCLENSLFQLGFATHKARSSGKYPRFVENCRRCWVPDAATKGREDVCKALGSPVRCSNKTCYEIY